MMILSFVKGLVNLASKLSRVTRQKRRGRVSWEISWILVKENLLWPWSRSISENDAGMKLETRWKGCFCVKDPVILEKSDYLANGTFICGRVNLTNGVSNLNFTILLFFTNMWMIIKESCKTKNWKKKNWKDSF